MLRIPIWILVRKWLRLLSFPGRKGGTSFALQSSLPPGATNMWTCHHDKTNSRRKDIFGTRLLSWNRHWRSRLLWNRLRTVTFLILECTVSACYKPSFQFMAVIWVLILLTSRCTLFAVRSYVCPFVRNDRRKLVAWRYGPRAFTLGGLDKFTASIYPFQLEVCGLLGFLFGDRCH